MREIKFRGRKSNGEWLYGDLVTTETTDGIHKEILPFDKVIFDASEEVEENTIGQFTGLHDKNGKEIYEGDILSTSNYGKDIEIGNQIKNVRGSQLYEVKMLLCNFVLDSKYRSHYLIYYKDYEVIGNIHDNPELLNK